MYTSTSPNTICRDLINLAHTANAITFRQVCVRIETIAIICFLFISIVAKFKFLSWTFPKFEFYSTDLFIFRRNSYSLTSHLTFGWNDKSPANMPKDYDYLLKVLLVGDSDVGKHEIMAGLEDASSESPFRSRNGNCKFSVFFFVVILLLLALQKLLKIYVVFCFHSIQNHNDLIGWQKSATVHLGHIR